MSYEVRHTPYPICSELDYPHSPIWCKECTRQELNNKMGQIAEAQLRETKRLADATEQLLDSREDDEPKPKQKAFTPIKYTPAGPVVVQQSEGNIKWKPS